jgi:hypothetical protein
LWGGGRAPGAKKLVLPTQPPIAVQAMYVPVGPLPLLLKTHHLLQ